MDRLHLLISGRVQGVWYRASTQKTAQELGLVGWVRNQRDGRVEAVAEGPRDRLEDLLAWAWRGPPAARVEDVKSEWGPGTAEFDAFSVRR